MLPFFSLSSCLFQQGYRGPDGDTGDPGYKGDKVRSRKLKIHSNCTYISSLLTEKKKPFHGNNSLSFHLNDIDKYSLDPTQSIQ